MGRSDRGHLALATGQPAHLFLARARKLVDEANVERRSELWRAVERLERASSATEAGQAPMVGGERLGDIPEGLRQRLHHRTS